MDAVVGCRAGTGWAVLVSVAAPGAGDAGAIAVLDRRRTVLVGDGDRFAYHRAAELDLDQAADLVATVRERASASAGEAIQAVAAGLDASGARIAVAALVGPPPGPVPALRDVVRSHAAIHTAEGALYRSVLADAFAAVGVAVRAVPPRELLATAAGASGIEPGAVEQALADLGRRLGPPWRKEHKEATLAAWAQLRVAARRPAGRDQP
jgi:hypothetical protein